MMSSVIAAFFHCVSGKNNSLHGQCPEGSESWCRYQRAKAAGSPLKEIEQGLPNKIINQIKPTYLKLCNETLLKNVFMHFKYLNGHNDDTGGRTGGCLGTITASSLSTAAKKQVTTVELGSNPGMDVCKCILPFRHEGTLNSRRVGSPLVCLMEGEERWDASSYPQGFLPLNSGGTEQNCTVTSMVLKAKANEMRKN
ncbi:uncharacterized protein LOC101238613 [Trichonephila clavipes]|nr:uncharacterized protein LOC101238613 [Trichonephila clavipes]